MNATGSVTGMSCSPTSASASAWNRNWRTRPRTTCYRAVPIDPSSKTGFARPWRAPAGRAGWPRCSIWIWTASNASLGHLAGDTLIQFAAERLAGCLRESETLSRSGGDRFTLVLGDVGAPEDAVHVAERILETRSPPFSVKGNEVFLGASIGIALYPQDGVDLPALQRAADSALYAAKRQGGRIRLSNPEISQEANRRLGVETELHHALERDEISVHIRFGHWPRGRIGGAGALGQSEVRTSPAIRSDSDSGRERAHRADRRPRAARRLPPGQVVAGRRLWAHASGRQYFSRAIPRGAIWPKPWRPRSPRRACGVAPGPGSHRGRDHARYPGNRPAAQGTEETGGERLLGRLWDRLFLFELPGGTAHRQSKNRPQVCAADERRGQYPHAGSIHRGSGARAGHAGGGRGRGNRRAARTTQGHGMRPGAKLHAGRTRAGAVDSGAVGGARRTGYAWGVNPLPGVRGARFSVPLSASADRRRTEVRRCTLKRAPQTTASLRFGLGCSGRQCRAHPNRPAEWLSPRR